MLWLAAAVALTINPYLDEGRHLYDQMQFELAESKLNLARKVTGATVEERREAYRLLALTRVARGRHAEAENAFTELLAEQPNAPEPDVAPNVLALFDSAKRTLYPPPFVRLRLLALSPDVLTVEVIDPWRQVEHLELVEPPKPTGPVMALVQGRASYGAKRPEKAAVVAFSREGQALSRLDEAGAGAVLVGSTPLPPSTSAKVAARWPTWVCLALAVAAASAATYLTVNAWQLHAQAGAAEWGEDQRRFDLAARDRAVASDVLWAGSAAGVALGAVLFFVF